MIFISSRKSDTQIKALRTLSLLSELINQAVGDAISDLLMVEAILTCKEWTLEDWDKAYTDLPSKQVKVSVSLI